MKENCGAHSDRLLINKHADGDVCHTEIKMSNMHMKEMTLIYSFLLEGS